MAGSLHKVAIEKAVGWSCRRRLAVRCKGCVVRGFIDSRMEMYGI